MNMDRSNPPQWLQDHPEVQARQINPKTLLKPFCVWQGDFTSPGRLSVVKIVEPGSNEADIYDQLHRLDPATPNHTMPCDVIRSAPQPFLIMQWLSNPYQIQSRDLCTVFDFFHQVLEGVAFLHEHRFVHLDIFLSNLLISRVETSEPYKLQRDKVYIIDYGVSRKLDLGPGHQPPIEIGECHYGPPEQMRVFDPYSWDVYCTGKSLEYFYDSLYRDDPVPWIVRSYVNWLIGKERGCTAVCRCRPSARRARQVAAVIRWLAHAQRTLMRLVRLKFVRDVLRRRRREE